MIRKEICITCDGFGWRIYTWNLILRSGAKQGCNSMPCAMCRGSGFIVSGDHRGSGDVTLGPVPASEMTEKDTERLEVEKEGG